MHLRPAVHRHASALGSWVMVSRPAHPALRPHVLGYQGYEERMAAPLRRLEVPSGEVHVILSFGPAIRVPERVTSFVAAPDDAHAVVEHEGRQHGVELRLTPPGAHRLLGIPMHELARRVVPVEDLLGRQAALLVEELHDMPDWTPRFALLDAVLARRLASGRPTTAGVASAWSRLVADRGATPVAELARETGWSRRHLAARFRDEVGLPPKTVARILRFRHAAERLRRADCPSLCEVALDCGYFDQAHLNRDFRAFAGCTPSELRARALPDGGGYAIG